MFSSTHLSLTRKRAAMQGELKTQPHVGKT